MDQRDGCGATRPDPNDISSVAQDYLKVIWSATEWGGPPMTTKTLARRFQTTQANVSETVRRLAGQGLLHYQPYRPVSLTAAGSAYAVAMVRRHRLLETFLVETLHYGWNEVHDEAERMEHAVSEGLVQRIAALLGEPEADPHGDPIPRADGTIPHVPGACPLHGAEPGRYTVVRVSDSDPATLVRLDALGVRPGVHVDVRADAVVVCATRCHLGRADLATIQVRLRML